MSSETIGRIIPDYNGVLAQALSWNQKRLDEVAKRSDLRTTIIIKEGNARESTTYENLGDTLAWKRIANPADLLRIGLGKKGHVEVSPIFPGARAEVYVNHQLVMQEVMQASRGRSDERLFVKTFDTLTRQGVDSILAREKLIMAARSGILVGFDLACLGIGAELTNLFFQGPITGIFFHPPTESLSWNREVMDSYFTYFIGRFTEVLIGLDFLKFDLTVVVDMVLYGLEARNSNDPYQRGFNDRYNPLKPIKDYLQGYFFLKSTPPLVEYKP